MRRTLRKSGFMLTAVALLAAAVNVAQADEYGEARAELAAAYEAADFERMENAAGLALEARPGYPGALFNLALAQVLNDRAYASLTTLNRLAALRIDYGVAGMDEFEPVRETPGWAVYAGRVGELAAPVGQAEVAYRHDAEAFVPEGIAIDADGTLYLGSIRNGDIVRLRHDEASAVVTAADAGHWSVYGMRLAGDTLWYASSAVEQFAGLDEADAGKNALFALDLESGVATRRAALPANDGWQVLGDFVIDDAGVFYLADQTDGVVYRFDPEQGGITPVVERGALRSPQGLVSAGDRGLYVADYLGGLFLVDIVKGTSTQVPAPDDTSLYGIDGLYAYGDTLIAIQNGIRPNRVVQLELSADGRSVTGSRILAMNLEHFDEPNLGQVVGDEFFFIANSHWNRFDGDGNLPEGLEGPIVLRIGLTD